MFEYPTYTPPGMNQYRAQTYKIIHVNGEGGARALQMAPNSEALLLDDTAPLIWLVQTDGAGYKTATPFSITPYQPAPPVNLQELSDRITRLEAKLNEKSSESAAE